MLTKLKMKLLVAGILVAISCIPTVQAQSLANADVVRTTLAINRDDSGIKACGLNFLVGVMAGDNAAVLYDFSVNIWHTADGLVKAGSHNIAYKKNVGWDFDNLKPRLPGPELMWLATRDDSSAIRPSRYIKGESPGFVLAGASGPQTLELLMAATKGDPMQVSIQYARDRIHRVIGFRTNLPQDDQSAMSDCLKALLKRMESDDSPGK